MATYRYKCPNCKNEKDYSHGMMESPEFKCESCNSIMNKVIGYGINYILPVEVDLDTGDPI